MSDVPGARPLSPLSRSGANGTALTQSAGRAFSLPLLRLLWISAHRAQSASAREWERGVWSGQQVKCGAVARK